MRGQETEEGRAALGPQISPIEHVTTSLPPIRIIHGDADMLVPLGQTRMVPPFSLLRLLPLHLNAPPLVLSPI